MWIIAPLLVFMCTGITQADDTPPDAPPPTRIEIESALTRMLWAEAGINRKGDIDRTAMLFAIHRLDEQERRSSNIIETLGYHVQWWKHGYPPKRPWIAGIDTACTEPTGFPSHLDWDVHRRGCYQLVARIRDYYAGRLRNPCKGTPNNWRGRGPPSRNAKRHYYHIGCGRTLHNYFDTWRTPNGKPTETIIRRLRKARRARLESYRSQGLLPGDWQDHAGHQPNQDEERPLRPPAALWAPTLAALRLRHACVDERAAGRTAGPLRELHQG